MAYDETPDRDQDLGEDADEAGEAEGVAEIEMNRPALAAADAQALDRETLEALDEEERASLEEAARETGTPTAEAAASMALSANFVLAEFHCCRGHCAAAAVPAAAVPALRRLVTHVLQPMRDRFGVCTVFSGYRNAAHNGHVGGAANSHHRYDVRPTMPAADVSFASGNVDAWAAEARQRLQQLGNIGGIGKYPAQRFVHVDLGPNRDW